MFVSFYTQWHSPAPVRGVIAARPDGPHSGRWELGTEEWIPIAVGVSAAFGFIFIPRLLPSSREDADVFRRDSCIRDRVDSFGVDHHQVWKGVMRGRIL